MDKNPSMLRATLIGGSVFGVIAAVPILGALNCACCALVAGGGFLAAYLYSKECRDAGAAFTPGNGALVGLVAGLFYALAGTVVGAVFKAIMGPPDLDQMMHAMEQFDLPPEVVDQASIWFERFAGVMGIVLGFFVSLLLAAVFSTLGGLIGGAVFKVEPAPPAPGFGAPPTGHDASIDPSEPPTV